MLMRILVMKTACRRNDADGYRPVEPINQSDSLAQSMLVVCFFHVAENTSPILPVFATALQGPVLRVPTNRHIARQFERSVPHASRDVVTDDALFM